LGSAARDREVESGLLIWGLTFCGGNFDEERRQYK